MIVSRFAPAPTGLLHLGHVLNALHVWGITRAVGGRVLLRIEDHDRRRSRGEYERGILDDLDWLGFVPDEPSTGQFRAGRCLGRQSDRGEIYESALARLAGEDRTSVGGGDASTKRAGLQAGRVYACDCTRRELRAAMEGTTGPVAADAELRYSGRCATRGLVWRPGLGLRVPIPDTLERFGDLRHGLQEQRPFEQCGDILLKDRDGNWTYQFAVTVDDLEQGVNLVIRGDDLLASTGRQILLARMLGRDAPPRFLHHGLIMQSATQKLSKANRDTSVQDMRTAGVRAEEVIGRALHAAGFAERPTPLARADGERMVARQYSSAVERIRTSP